MKYFLSTALLLTFLVTPLWAEKGGDKGGGGNKCIDACTATKDASLKKCEEIASKDKDKDKSEFKKCITAANVAFKNCVTKCGKPSK